MIFFKHIHKSFIINALCVIGLHSLPAEQVGIFAQVKYTGITYAEGYSNLISLNVGVTFKFGKKIGWKPPVIEVPETTPYYEKR